MHLPARFDKPTAGDLWMENKRVQSLADSLDRAPRAPAATRDVVRRYVRQNVAWNSPPVVKLEPATSPRPLTACARLAMPPRVPRSTMPPVRVQEKAWP